MAGVQTARVVPSGKVYRQMFDAQVQLNKSLSAPKSAQFSLFDSASRNGSIPLVRTSTDNHAHGLLTDRQRTWIQGLPNDPHSENPVLYRQYTDFVAEQLKETETDTAKDEVSSLPDVVVPARSGSDIIERITQNKKDRHDAALEDMRQELCMISGDLEPRIREHSEMLQERLAESDAEMERIMSSLESEQVLINHTYSSLVTIWDDLTTMFATRKEWVKELDTNLKKVEDDRMKLITKVFESCTRALEKIAYKHSADLHRLLNKHAQSINQSVLSNHRSYADLYMKLMMMNIERERLMHVQWKERLAEWKQLHRSQTADKFSLFMKSDAVNSSPYIQDIIDKMKVEQKIMNGKRLELINTLNDFKPPGSTKVAVYQWNKQCIHISQQIDTLNQQFLNGLQVEYEKLCRLSIEEADKHKVYLMESSMCTLQEAKVMVERHFMPLLGEKQKEYERIMETMEKAYNIHNRSTLKQIRFVFRFAQGIAHIWDMHEIALAKQERTLQEELEKSRRNHDNQNQEKEAQLDILMDRMRQEGTENLLNLYLGRVVQMLTDIQQSYEAFHRQQVAIVQNYPDMAITELQTYDSVVCQYFDVDRKPPKPKSGRSSARARSAADSERGPLQQAIAEVLATTNGTTFYVLTSASAGGTTTFQQQDDQDTNTPIAPSPHTVSPQVTGSDDSMYEDALDKDTLEIVQSVNVPATFLQDVKDMIRLNFLNHLEEWKTQAVERAQSVVAAKIEELNSELDLRLHLHEPRERRAELDVRNVRAAELVLHSDRVTRHTKGVISSLSELKAEFASVSNEHNRLLGKFNEDIQKLEDVFANATKAAKLMALQNQLQVELDRFMMVIRTSLRKFRQHLDERLQTLRESNARFIKSFKMFSDGGNFCPDEIEDYRKRLERMSHRIDVMEGAIMMELEGMESKRLEEASKITMQFEDKFKSNLFDLIFIERIAHWLTNIQVKVKAEVADSNSQAKRLAIALQTLTQQIDACVKPRHDKLQIQAEEVNEGLEAVFKDFYNRSVYLNCLVPELKPTSLTPSATPSIVDVEEKRTKKRPGKGKRATRREPSPGLKSTLKSVKESKRDEEDTLERDGGAASPASQHSQASEGGAKGSFRKTAVKTIGRGERETSKTPGSGLQRSRHPRFDKKILVFGERSEMKEEHILWIIRAMLRDSLEGLLMTADMFYKQKGGRSITRPQVLQDTFDQCADVLVTKLQSYWSQAEKYHNACLQEYKEQLRTLESLIISVPPLVVTNLLTIQKEAIQTGQQELMTQFDSALQELDTDKAQNEQDLRPKLGHPQQMQPLQELCDRESERHNRYVQTVEDFINKFKCSAETHADDFIKALSSEAERNLLLFNKLLVVDEVIKGDVEPKRFSTNELIRRNKDNLPLIETEDETVIPRGPGRWEGIPSNEMTPNKADVAIKLTDIVTTVKTTLGHNAVIKARDQAYKEYKALFDLILEEIETMNRKYIHVEERWQENWSTSVEKIKQLY